MPKTKEKIFVLDTNVILHDSSCIHQFEEHDIVIPITVLEELDNFKKGSGTLSYHARQFMRTFDSLVGDRLFSEGFPLGENRGKITVALEPPFHESLQRNFRINKADHHILNIAYHLFQERKNKQVILVTKDVSLRMKAKSVGLLSQDYTTDHVKNPASLYRGFRCETGIASSVIDQLYGAPFEIDSAEVTVKDVFRPNEYAILKNGKKSALARYNADVQTLTRIDKVKVYGITPRNAEQAFALDALLDPKIKLVTISGKAGTGKTLLALVAGLACRKDYRQIYMARPIVPLSNRDIGFLPGDIQSKLDPYMQPLYDNLGVIQSQYTDSDPKNKKIRELLDNEKLVISPLSYIRGRSLVKIFFIVDEAQNLTPHEIKTIITRAGEGSKVIFTGDIFQIDHPYLDSQSNGLSHLIEKMQGQQIYAHINLEKGERSELADLAGSLL